MTYRLTIRPEAYADLAEAQDWYESQRPGLGAEMATEVLRRARDAVTRPQQFQIIRQPDVRRVLVDRFPYAIYFTVHKDRVVVLGIFHTRRNRDRLLDERM